MRLSRGSAFVGGVVFTVVIGGGTAVATGGPSVLFGHGNVGKATTGLADTKGTPLSLVAKKGAPPLKVSNTVKIRNLDSDLLDGKDSTSFLPNTGKAADSSLLGGQPPTAFLGAGATAADSAELGGQPAANYVGSVYAAQNDAFAKGGSTPLLSSGAFFDVVTVPAGTYEVDLTADLANTDMTTGDFACELVYMEGASSDYGFLGHAAAPPASAGGFPRLGTVSARQAIILPATTTVQTFCFPLTGDTLKTSYVSQSTLTATRLQDLHGTVETFDPTMLPVYRKATPH